MLKLLYKMKILKIKLSLIAIVFFIVLPVFMSLTVVDKQVQV